MHTETTEPLYLSPTQRAAVVSSYRDLFSPSKLVNKDRRITFQQSMRLRALWITGTPLRELANTYFSGRTESVARILCGDTFVNPRKEERATFRDHVEAFFAALSACEFGPANALHGTAKVLPLERFLAGEHKPAPPLDDDEGELVDAEEPPRKVVWGFALNAGTNVVGSVIEGAPAAAAGLQAGDEITKVNGDTVATSAHIAPHAGGDVMVLSIIRPDESDGIERLTLEMKR